MRFITALAVATSAAAQTAHFAVFYTPTSYEVLTAGSHFNLTWSNAVDVNENVTVHLLKGNDTNHLAEVGIVVRHLNCTSTGTYNWHVPLKWGRDKDIYGLYTTLDSDPDNVYQWSNPFNITQKCKITRKV